MSSNCSTSGVVGANAYTGPHLIQVDDFFQSASILHPLVIGTIAIICLFLYLRCSSNRCIAPVTLFDVIMNVALGSTLAGIVNGTSLVRGLISLVTLVAFQFINSQLSTHYGVFFERALNSPPLMIAFRGRSLDSVMRKHRISTSDLYLALRGKGIWDISEVEAVIIEPTGQFSIYKKEDRPEGCKEPGVLMDVPAYKRLVEHFDKGGRERGDEKRNGTMKRENGNETDEAADIAADAA